jgi:lipopolysaccharide export LptBFGC system permease protein LptF
MKKLLILLISFGTFTTLFAQSTSEMEEAKRVILGQKKNSRTNDGQTRRDDDRRVNEENGTRYPGSREAEIERVNREYETKIQSIRNNPTLSAEEKERMIRQLNKERVEKIRRINKSYKDRDDDNDDDYDKKDKKYGKNNNGKKLGWEKGVGNPHRTGSDKEFGHEKNKGKDKQKDKSSKGKVKKASS